MAPMQFYLTLGLAVVLLPSLQSADACVKKQQEPEGGVEYAPGSNPAWEEQWENVGFLFYIFS